jgi:chloramphenicol 3-O phosphotransferase
MKGIKIENGGKRRIRMSKPNVLIVLNGASSSGKTTIARALQPFLGERCIVTGFDEILERVRPFGPEDGNFFNKITRPLRVMQFQFTDGRLKLFKQLHREVVAHYYAGRDVIADTAWMDKRVLLDGATCFAPLGGFFIGVKPPLEISEQWEAARGDRRVGQARAHYDLIHEHGIYDLIVDPSSMTPQEAAQTIMNRLQGPPPDAFQRIINNR